jgi:hypothetical protein
MHRRSAMRRRRTRFYFRRRLVKPYTPGFDHPMHSRHEAGGAGKSSTIKSLQKRAEFHLVDEDLTFGDFVTDLFAVRDRAARRALDRMMGILDEISSHELGRVVLEFFTSPCWRQAVDGQVSRDRRALCHVEL